ncbi:hypothetical protein [Streptomyces acidiscabies]|uniref:Uncharacterized protein n=1 Tax=Streptomyces acidiscabies TaxID=42234 RepID=A0ABU4MAZ2_9ACTN|nr:hypothetical protein [Streptomyces acidiscabies]MDX3024992.1 hypothetical protein [Streptomyces acidiscabies]
MLIERADQLQLTRTLVEDPARWSPSALVSANDSVVHDAGQSAHLMAAWAQVVAAGTLNPAGLFTRFARSHERWAELGAGLAAVAALGALGPLEATAEQCAAELDPAGRSDLLARLAAGVSETLHAAGGLDELLEAASLLHRSASDTETGWATTATWALSVLTANRKSPDHAGLVAARNMLLVEEGHGPALWETWSKVAAIVMPPALPDQPGGLWLRAVQAVRAGDEHAARDVLTEFRAQDPLEQSLLCHELASRIASVRAHPSPRATHAPAPQDEEVRRAAEDIVDEMPSDVAEHTGRMHALSRRAVLAYLDQEAKTLAAVIDRIATWDDAPGRRPYPGPRFRYPVQQALLFADQLLTLPGPDVYIPSDAAANAAGPLIDRYAPDAHKDAAHQLIAALRTAGPSGTDLDEDASYGPAGLVAYAALAAGLIQHPQLRYPREKARLNLIQEIRESEAAALRIPDRERITVSDEEAHAFLQQLHPGYPIPRDPHARTIWDHDIIAVVTQHLLDHPADSTTPEQRRALDARIHKVLRAAEGTLHAQTPRPGNAGRKQPNRSTKRKRRGR